MKEKAILQLHKMQINCQVVKAQKEKVYFRIILQTR